MDARLRELRRQAYSNSSDPAALWRYIQELERGGAFSDQPAECGTTTVACHVLTEEDGIHPGLYRYLCASGWNLCLTASPDVWVPGLDLQEGDSLYDWIGDHYYDMDRNPPFVNNVPKHLMIDLYETWDQVISLLHLGDAYDSFSTEDLFYEDGGFNSVAYHAHKDRFVALVNSYMRDNYHYLILDFSLLQKA